MNREELNKLFDEHFINDCNEVYDSQNEIVDFAEKAVKLFTKSNVSNRRELLFAFLKANENQTIPDYDSNKHLMIDAFLGKQ